MFCLWRCDSRACLRLEAWIRVTISDAINNEHSVIASSFSATAKLNGGRMK